MTFENFCSNLLQQLLDTTILFLEIISANAFEYVNLEILGNGLKLIMY